MPSEALISEKRFSGVGGLAGLKRRPLPMRGAPTAGEESPIPFEYELAFERGEISARTYKAVVDKALDAVAPGTTMYRALMREQSAAMRRIEEEKERTAKEGRKLRKLQAKYQVASTLGNTYADAVYMYDFWIKEGEKAEKAGDIEYALQAYTNAGNQRTIADARARAEARKGAGAGKKAIKAAADDAEAEWKADDASFERDVKDINDLARQGQYGTRKNEKDEDVDEMSFVLGKLYQEWIATIEARIDYLEENPEINEEMSSKFDVEGLRFQLEGGITSMGNEQMGLNDHYANAKRLLNTAPSTLVMIADPEKNRVTQEIAPANIKTEYIKDEYGTYHKLDFVNIEGEFLAVANVLKPDGTVIRVSSGNIGKKENYDPDKTDFYFEDGKLVSNYNGYGSAFEGRRGLTGVDVSSPEFIKDVLNINDPFAIQSVQADIKFKQLSDQYPEFKAQEALFGSSGMEALRDRAYDNDARAAGLQDQLMESINTEMEQKYKEIQRTRNEAILEGDVKKLGKATKLWDEFRGIEEGRTAELQLKKPMSLVTPKQQTRIESRLAPQPRKGNIMLPSLMNVATPGQAPKQSLGPMREQKQFKLGKAASLSKTGVLKLKKPPKPKKPILKEKVGGATVKWWKPKPKKYQIIKLPKAWKSNYPKGYEAQLRTIMKKIKWV